MVIPQINVVQDLVTFHFPFLFFSQMQYIVNECISNLI